MAEVQAQLAKVTSDMPSNIIQAHTHSSGHRSEIATSKQCGCFYCLYKFSPTEIKNWVDEGKTALCPKCEIDSVLGDASGYPITTAFLKEMHKYWFE